MNLTKFHTVVDNTPSDVQAHVKLSMDILERIHELLEKKFQGKQHLLAKTMCKSEAEVSKWLSGIQNFTTRTLAKMEVAFGEPIIVVCAGSRRQHPPFVQVKMPYYQTRTPINVTITGASYKPVDFPTGKSKMHRSGQITNPPA